MQFVHLGIHTEFSITESIVRIPDLVKVAVAEEMPALAITDLSNLHAAVKFYGACLGKGIKPIMGSVIRLNDAEHRATLLAMSNKGWRNLTEIVSRGFIEGQQLSTPCIQKEWILEQAQDLIQHLPMLRGHAHHGLKPRGCLQCLDQGSHLDGLGPRAKYHHHLHASLPFRTFS